MVARGSRWGRRSVVLLAGVTTAGGGAAAAMSGCGEDDCTLRATCDPVVSPGAGGSTTSGTAAGGNGGSGGGTETCVPMSTELCYSGPEGTEDVGICQGGTRTCGVDGTWGPCDGEVVPAVESCQDATTDENCDGLECVVGAFAYPQGDGAPAGLVAAADDLVVVHGTFAGGLSIGDLSASGGALPQPYFLGLDAQLSPEWLVAFGGDISRS